MINEQKNMEDFLREKLSHGEEDFTDDWSVFEQKLERATFFKQMRVGALVSVVLIMLSIGFFGGSSFSRFNVFQSASNQSSESYRGEGRFSDFSSDKNLDHKSVAASKNLNEELGKSTEVKLSSQSVVETSASKQVEPAKKAIAFRDVSASSNNNVKSADIKPAGSAIIEKPIAEGEATSQTFVAGQEPTSETTLAEETQLAMADDELNAEEELIPEVAAEPAGLIASNSRKVSGGGGQALIPDGLVTSNYKANVKPIELMIDPRDVKTMSLKAPVIPMKLTPATKEPYVSPLQEKSPWSYSIKVYPNFTYRKFSVAANKMPYIHRDFIDQVKVSESGGFSLNVGFEASKRIGRITYLNAGVEYISYKTEANFDFINYRDAVINTESGKITSYDFRDEPEHIVIVDDNRYHYLNFPLSIAYRPWATDHVRLNIEAGASYMYFIKASGKSIDYQSLDIIDLSEREYRNSMASICLKVGASYHVSEKFSLGFEPTVVYFSNTIYTEEYPFEVVPYSVGVNFKLQMKLN